MICESDGRVVWVAGGGAVFARVTVGCYGCGAGGIQFGVLVEMLFCEIDGRVPGGR